MSPPRLMASLAASLLLASLVCSCGALAPRSAADAALPKNAKLLPARVRRLSNIEYERTVSELVGAPQNIVDRLPPDVRQDGFTLNAAQVVPPAWATRLDAIASQIAHETVEKRLDRLTPRRGNQRAPSAHEFVSELGRRALRRPLAREEESALLAAFADGAADGNGFKGGAEVVLRILLQSPSLLYLTELGAPTATPAVPGTRIRLTAYEIASLLSYTVRGGPPDEALLRAADSGELVTGQAREHHARRLLGLSDTRHHFRRFVLEWLEVDGLERTAKSASLFPSYERLRPAMLAETTAFIDEVMVHDGASIRTLLTAGFASVEPDMARFYGLRTYGPRASLSATRRRGLLQQASFLATHAHEDSTSPVKRGDFVMRKLLCNKLKRPAEVGIEVVIPPPSKALTTRERFTAHVANPSCSGCHHTLDALGYAFETFDAMGKSRATENGRPIDSLAELHWKGKQARFEDSLELSEWLGQMPVVSECFARHAFRYFSAEADPEVEATFLALRSELPERLAGNLIEELVLFVKSDLFIEREVTGS